MGMSLRAQNARIILIGLSAWYKMVWKKQNIGPMWENSAERKRPRISNAIKISSVLRLHEKRAKVDPQAVQSKTELFKKLPTTRETDE